MRGTTTVRKDEHNGEDALRLRHRFLEPTNKSLDDPLALHLTMRGTRTHPTSQRVRLPPSPLFGIVAQLVEYLTLNQNVVGSNPTDPTTSGKMSSGWTPAYHAGLQRSLAVPLALHLTMRGTRIQPTSSSGSIPDFPAFSTNTRVLRPSKQVTEAMKMETSRKQDPKKLLGS